MPILKRIEPLPFAKVQTIIAIITGFILGLIYTIFSSASFYQVGFSEWLIGPFAIIFDPIIFGIFAFIVSIIIAIIYNSAAAKIGGIEFRMDSTENTTELKGIDAISFAKIYTLLLFFSGFIAGALNLVRYLLNPVNNSIYGSPIYTSIYNLFYGPWSIIVDPIIYAVVGFILALIVAAIYNAIRPRIGGVILKFRKSETNTILEGFGVISTAKIATALFLIFGIIYGSIILILLGSLGVGVGALSFILIIIISAVSGFIVGAVDTFLFNFAAGYVKGIPLKFE